MIQRLFINRILIMAAALLVMSCTSDDTMAQPTIQKEQGTKLYLTIGNQTLPATLVVNKATEELLAALAESPITYEADDYGGFEKVGPLGRSLTTSNQQLKTVAGDIILYSGNQIVLFYGSNSWSYTRLGRIEYSSLEQLKDFLQAGKGRVKVTLSVEDPSAVNAPKAETASKGMVALNGVKATTLPKGIYIENGKKIIK